MVSSFILNFKVLVKCQVSGNSILPDLAHFYIVQLQLCRAQMMSSEWG